MNSLHTYNGDYVRHSEKGIVGRIIATRKRYYWGHYEHDVKWSNGKIEVHDYDIEFITDYEYFKVMDPSKCGADLPKTVLRECYFTNKMHNFGAEIKEDFF